MRRDLIKKVQSREAAIEVNTIAMANSSRERKKLHDVIAAAFPKTVILPAGHARFFFAEKYRTHLWDYSDTDRGLDGMEIIPLDEFLSDEL